MELKDKVIVITGGSSGLGEVMAQAFIKEGSKMVISSRSEKKLKEVSQKIKVESFVADVTDEKQVNNLRDFAVQKFGRIDIWINNAGIWIPYRPIEQMDSRRVHAMFEVNVFGAMYGSKTALIQMRAQHSGTIMNILSTSALEGRLNSSGYSASKFAANGFTKSLRLEAKPDGISVIAVFPGGMKTHFFDEKKPADFDAFMDPTFVAEKIIENLKYSAPEEELVIKRK
ncbi:MAG: SDR family oxidoreductase [Patescibacteria group bacterium]|nr:SDR family oxidoreductase [Patescibacteria group bacterium]